MKRKNEEKKKNIKKYHYRKHPWAVTLAGHPQGVGGCLLLQKIPVDQTVFINYVL